MDAKTSIELINTHLAFDLTLDDFNHPKPERVQLICKAFIMLVFEIPESVVSHLPLEALADTDEPELMQRSAPLIMVYTTMHQFVADMANNLEFSMDDLISPTPPRFRRLAQFMADYLKFHMIMMPQWEETCAIYADKRKELEELTQAVHDAEKKRDTVLIEAEGRKRRENELMTILGKKQADFQLRFSAAKELDATVERNKEIIEEEQFKQKELVYEKDSMQMNLDQLSLQIMPEHINNERERLSEEVKRLREECEVQRKKCEETRNLIDLAPKVHHMIERASVFTEQLLNKKNILDQKLMEKTDLEQRERDAERKLRDMVDLKNTADNDHRVMEENYQRDRLMHQERMVELAKRREELEQEMAELKRVNACDPAAERKLRAEIANVRSMRDEVISSYKTSEDRCVQAYKRLIKAYNNEITTYHEERRYYEDVMKHLQVETADTTNMDFNDTANQTIPQY